MPRYRKAYSLYERDGYYYYRTYDDNGVRTPGRSTGCTAKSAACAYCDKLLREGRLYIGSEETFRQYSEKYFAQWKRERREGSYMPESTERLYENQLAHTIYPILGDKKLSEINAQKMRTIRSNMLDGTTTGNKLTAGYVSKLMSLVHKVFKSALADGLIVRDPCIGITAGRSSQKSKRDAFTLDEIKRLVSVSGTERGIITLMACTGIRPSEAPGLRIGDILSKDGSFYIDLKNQLFRGHYVPVKTKDARNVPVCAELYEMLKGDAKDDGYIYKYALNSFEALVKAYVLTIGISEDERKTRLLTPHALRHFFSTNAKASGVPGIKVEYVSGHMLHDEYGHSGTGERVYTNFKIDDLQDVLEYQKTLFLSLRNN